MNRIEAMKALKSGATITHNSLRNGRVALKDATTVKRESGMEQIWEDFWGLKNGAQWEGGWEIAHSIKDEIIETALTEDIGIKDNLKHWGIYSLFSYVCLIPVTGLIKSIGLGLMVGLLFGLVNSIRRKSDG